MTPAISHPSRPLSWRTPSRERLVLLLVVLATLTPVYAVSAQDLSRLCLSRALLTGHLTIDHCIANGTDRARYGGHLYSDKAPGFSFLALPALLATGLPRPTEWRAGPDLHVWAVRILTSGLAFILLVWMVGRVAEGLVAGTGPPVAVTFALGTLAGGLAATTFDQVAAAALGFGAFVLAGRRRPGWSGLCVGLAVFVEYQAILLAAPIAAYAVYSNRQNVYRFAVGALPGLVALGCYDWAAFGSPLHTSYRYVANGYTRAQASGFFGISLPHRDAVWDVLVGDRGLLLASPILLAAAAGLLMLARRSRPEALLCGTVAGLYLLLEFGYFLPYGGVSPGPRFLLPAIPFLALGLAPMYQKRHRLTVLLAVPSIVASTAVAVTWSSGVQRYQQTIWGQLVRSALRADSHLRRELTDNLLSVFGVGRMEAALAVSASSGLALLVALRSRRSEPTTAPAGSIATLELGVSTDSTVTLELAAFEPVDGGAT